MFNSNYCSSLFICAAALSSHAADTITVSINGEKLSINGGETMLGAANWSEPGKSWRTVGELMKSALPPGDRSGIRGAVTLQASVDKNAPWGALKTVLMAAAALGIPQVHLNVSTGPDTMPSLDFKLPGADTSGEVAELPLTVEKGAVMTENNGKKIPCNRKIIDGLVRQLPKATVHVTAPNDIPAFQMAGVLNDLAQAKAAAIAFLPVHELGAVDGTTRKEAQDAVERALSGGLGGLGK